MRRDFRYTGIHNIQNNLKFRRNFRWKVGLPLKKIRIQRVSVFDIAVTLHDSDLAMSDADQALYQVKQNGRHGCGFY